MVTPADLRPRGELGGGGGIKGTGGPRREKHSTARLSGKRLMRAAWWWIDRWRKSTAYTDMSLAEQGAYRNLLDELWLRDGAIPNDERILAKVCGDPFEWATVRDKVLARFTLTPEGWRNSTHDEVSKGTKDFRQVQAEKGRKGAAKRWHSPANGPAISPANGLPSPSPSPSPSVISSSEGRKEAAYLPPPVERAERAVNDAVRTLQLKLGSLIASLAEHPASRKMVPDWCRAVTAYDKADGTKVRGVPDWRTVFSIDRLERSIADAEWHLAELDKEAKRGA